MARTKTTKKYLRTNFKNIIKCGYCTVQHLMNLTYSDYYLTRTEGWAADVYILNSDTILVTGYAPFGNIEPSYQTLKKYEDEATKLVCGYCDYETLKDGLDNLIEQFLNEVIKG